LNFNLNFSFCISCNSIEHNLTQNFLHISCRFTLSCKLSSCHTVRCDSWYDTSVANIVVVCRKPGMFYFQSVSTDSDKMLSCVVLVRERQRSVIVSLYTELCITCNVWFTASYDVMMIWMENVQNCVYIYWRQIANVYIKVYLLSFYWKNT